MLLYNGQLLPDEHFALTLPNRGLFFNDGFFETMVWVEGGIRYLSYHLARMQQAAGALGLQLPVELAAAQNLTTTLATLLAADSKHFGGSCRVRLQVWRSGGGLYTPTTDALEWLVTAQPFQAQDAPVATADFASTVHTHFSPVSFCKGPNSLTYVLAARERAHRSLEELILLNTAGHVAESVSAAVFWITDGCLYTPALTTGCVAGVRRAHLLSVASQHGMECRQGLFHPKELLEAELVFTANVAGIRVLRRLQERHWSAVSPLLAQLREWEAR
ncbi:aminotransferase class IV [Hymenobacter tibetensis]|uniref:branched-chain-amino-acid transaminase n=1 Tax=Hymenobacter tibetensis TaxID=497967 RepID=A0ABY4CUV2_9BACT|nr:aminotransferase class IV [Hymenobacter tibetensis]UOG72791.1 aminotransferase class IV [Hymenobacter tibetensis]